MTLDNQAINIAKIICIGKNYTDHIKEMGDATPSEMVLFAKPVTSANTELILPKKSFRFEAEICLLMNEQKIIGIGIGLDMTLDEIQKDLKNNGLPWERSKGFKNSGIYSDFVSVSNIDQSQIELKFYVNDNLKQHAKSSQMVYSISHIVDECESVFGLNTYDIIMTGTPSGIDTLREGDKCRGELYHQGELVLQKEWVAKS